MAAGRRQNASLAAPHRALAKLARDMGRTFATGLPPLRGFGGSRRPLPLSRTSCPAGRSSPARPARVRRSCSVTVCSVLHRLQRHRCSAPTPRQGQHPQGPHRGRPRRASRTLCSPVRPRNGRPNGLPDCSARPCAPLLRCLLRERGAARCGSRARCAATTGRWRWSGREKGPSRWLTAARWATCSAPKCTARPTAAAATDLPAEPFPTRVPAPVARPVALAAPIFCTADLYWVSGMCWGCVWVA